MTEINNNAKSSRLHTTMRQRERNGVSGLEISNAAKLYAETFPEPAYIIRDLLLAAHLTLVAGRPKSWKTWWVLGIAIAVALCKSFLDREMINSGRVLFCELDDDRRQLNERMHVLLPKLDADELEALKNITFVHALERLGEGGIFVLEQRLKKARDAGRPYQLLIIDPYIAVRSSRKGGDWSTDNYEEMKWLRQLCIEYNCACIIVHHLRKAKSPYAIDQVLGSTGLLAARVAATPESRSLAGKLRQPKIPASVGMENGSGPKIPARRQQ